MTDQTSEWFPRFRVSKPSTPLNDEALTLRIRRSNPVAVFLSRFIML